MRETGSELVSEVTDEERWIGVVGEGVKKEGEQKENKKEMESRSCDIRERSQAEEKGVICPYRFLSGHFETVSRPQYSRTCGISSLVALWNYQFSTLGQGKRDPINIEQAMLKLNLIGNGSVGEQYRNRNKRTKELSETVEQEEEEKLVRAKNLQSYIESIEFGGFTGNSALLKWYRILCRIYGGSGRSEIFYKTNSGESVCRTEEEAKRKLLEGLVSEGRTCFIYHAHDHYFCPVGYELLPSNSCMGSPDGFDSRKIPEGQLTILVAESSKLFPCLHNFRWEEIMLDLSTFWPKFYNIRRRHQGVKEYPHSPDTPSADTTINCIMAFHKIKD